jgi:hypothetical protein
VIRYAPVVAERCHQQKAGAVRVAGNQGFPGRAGTIDRAGAAGLQPAARQQLGNLVHFGQRGLEGILEVGDLLAGHQSALAHRIGGPPGRRQG